MEHPEQSRQLVAVGITPVEPHPISGLYRLGLIAVAMGLMLLPVAYFGLVAAIVWGVYWHIQQLDWYMEHLRGLWGMTIFIAPILTGAVIVFFMIRPLFVRSERAAEALTITPEAEPDLFHFVAAICNLLQAPFPKHIYVDWRANASASLHRGVKSFFNRELDLTLGLPLIAALSVGQLGGVLAHEFGHFAQGAGMRFNYLIRSMNGWLARVAFQPGDIEQNLAQSGVNRNLWGQIALGMARLGLWIARRTLHGLTLLGHAISCFSLRQMEFDADLYEAKVSGPVEFAAVTERLGFLSVGWESANGLLAQSLGDNQLPRDFAALTLARTEAAIEYRKRDIEQARTMERSGWFNTHPSARDRIERVRRAGVTPAFADSRRATELFHDFTALSEQVTLQYYRTIGLPVHSVKLLDVEEICEGRSLSPTKLAAVRIFFGDRLSSLRPLVFGPTEISAPLPNETAESSIRQNRELWQQTFAETQDAFENLAKATGRFIACEKAHWLREARVRFKPADFLLTSRSPEEIALCGAEALSLLAEIEPDLARFDEVVRRRLIDALRLPDVAAARGPAPAELLAALQAFQPVFDRVRQLRNDFAAYQSLYFLKQSQSPRRKAHTLRLELAQTLNHQLSGLNPLLRDLVLPYGEREPMLTQIRRRLPDEHLPFEVTIYRDVSVYLQEVDVTYYRIMGDLCLAAEKAETTVLPLIRPNS
jgi:hypothetical protein